MPKLPVIIKITKTMIFMQRPAEGTGLAGMRSMRSQLKARQVSLFRFQALKKFHQNHNATL